MKSTFAWSILLLVCIGFVSSAAMSEESEPTVKEDKKTVLPAHDCCHKDKCCGTPGCCDKSSCNSADCPTRPENKNKNTKQKDHKKKTDK